MSDSPLRPLAVGLNLNRNLNRDRDLSSAPSSKNTYFSLPFLRADMIPIPRSSRRGSDSVSTASDSSPPGAAGILAQLSESPSKPKQKPSPYMYLRAPPTPPQSTRSPPVSPALDPAVSHVQASAESVKVSASRSMPRLSHPQTSPSPRVGFVSTRVTVTAATTGAAGGLSIPRSQSASDRLSGMLERPQRPQSRNRKPADTGAHTPPVISPGYMDSASHMETPLRAQAVHVSDTAQLDAERSPTKLGASPEPTATREHTVRTPTPARRRLRKVPPESWLPTGLDDEAELELNHVDALTTTHESECASTANHSTCASTTNHSTCASTTNHSTCASTANHSTCVSTANHSTCVSTANHEPTSESTPTGATPTKDENEYEYVPPYAVRRMRSKPPQPTNSKPKPTSEPQPKPTPERYALTLTAALSSGADVPLALARRRIELELVWDDASGIWAHIPGARYIPSCRLRAAGGLSGTERGAWVRWIAAVPVVGAVSEWL